MKAWLHRIYYGAKHFLHAVLRDKRMHPVVGGSAYPDRVFYIIRFADTWNSGFFASYKYVLGHVIYADKKGMVPVVDMQNPPTLYSEAEIFRGTMNAWEYYFAPEYTLEQARSACHVYASDCYACTEYTPSYRELFSWWPTRRAAHRFARYIDRYMKVRDDILAEADDIYRAGAGDARCLGVHIRGTDMKTAADHPGVQPVERFLARMRAIVQKQHIEKIFLCSDEASIVEQVREAFGDMLFTTESYRSTDGSDRGIHYSENGRAHHKYLLGKEVLTDALLLSRCNCLLSGLSNVPLAATMMNGGKYEYTELLK